MSQNPPEGQTSQQTPDSPAQMQQQPPVSQFSAAPVAVPASEGNGMAAAGMVIGILAAVFAFIPFIGVISWVLAPLAIIFGAVGISKARTTGRGRGQAIAGVVLGVAALLISILWVVGLIGLFSDPEIAKEFEQISPRD